MPSISSLLKSAQATQKKIRNQEDAYVAYQWENSAQTYDDYLEYSKYLNERVKTASDPSEALTYQTKLRSANRSYTSNEIQREQMKIMEGRGDTSTKMEAVKNLWQRAVDSGDFNLAQNLVSQWESLSIKLQNEQEAAARAFASSAAASGGKIYTDLIKNLTKGYDDVTLPNGQKLTPLAAIARDMEANKGDLATWRSARETMEALYGAVVDQYNAATTQEQIDKLEEKYGPGLQDLTKNLTFNIGGKKLSAQEIINAEANEEMNNPIYSLKATRNEATGANEFKLVENNVSEYDFVRKMDENGNEYFDAVEKGSLAKATAIRTELDNLYFGTSDVRRDLDAQITNEGYVIGNGKESGNVNMAANQMKRDDSQSIRNRLRSLNIEARHDGTTLVIKLPGEGIERTATIQPDGSIRYVGDDGQLNEINLVGDRNIGYELDENGNILKDAEGRDVRKVFRTGATRTVSPDEISDFSSQSAFGGTLSKASKQGERYTQSITGATNADRLIPGRTPIRVGNDFSGVGGPVTAGGVQGTSMLLQGGAATRKAIEVEQQRQVMLQKQREIALQASANQFNLNQTPVQQLAGDGTWRTQIKVAAPQPYRRVYVAPPAPTPRITSTSVAPRTQNISSVGVATGVPRIRF